MDHSEPRVFGNQHSPAEAVVAETRGVVEVGALRFIGGCSLAADIRVFVVRMACLTHQMTRNSLRNPVVTRTLTKGFVKLSPVDRRRGVFNN